MKTDPRTTARRLRAWYRVHRRELPWRLTSDPYAIWVSEVMLQQTTVAVVRARWERFLARFPSVGALARAEEREVLAEWSGLGYYGRARNLHRAARLLAANGGVLPSDVDELRALPGIGAYTAAAIASIAFGAREAAVDGNVIRVVARVYGLRVTRGDAAGLSRVTRAAEALLPRRDPGGHNQALMDLGSLVCTPRAPLCAACPLVFDCRAAALGHPERYPRPAARQTPVAIRLAAGVAFDGGSVLLTEDHEMVRGHLVVPLVRLSSSDDGAEVLLAAWPGLSGRAAARVVALGRVRHSVLARRYDVEVFRVVEDAAKRRTSGARTVPLEEIATLPRGGLLAKVLALAGAAR